MATTFGGSSNRFLSPSEKKAFYNKMRGIVVVVRSRENDLISEGAGFVINKHGCVLTCSHVLPENWSIEMKRFNEEFKPAKLVSRRLGCDLAMIKPADVYDDYEYCKLADDQALIIGMEVLTISHPLGLYFSFDSGHVAHGFNGDVADRRVADGLDTDDEGHLEVLEFNDGDNPVLQICGLSTCHGSSGGPIFDCTGTVVGMYGFCTMDCVGTQVPVTCATGFPLLKDFVSKVDLLINIEALAG